MSKKIEVNLSKRDSLIVKDLKLIKKYLKGIKIEGNKPQTPFKCRITQPKLSPYVYRTDSTFNRWFLVADFENDNFEIVNEDFLYNSETKKGRSYEQSFPLDLTESDLRWMIKDDLFEEFFFYAEGLLEKWSNTKAKLHGYLAFEKYNDTLVSLEKFKV